MNEAKFSIRWNCVDSPCTLDASWTLSMNDSERSSSGCTSVALDGVNRSHQTKDGAWAARAPLRALRGHMASGLDPRKALNCLKVLELKQLCKEEGLNPNGRKVELIERLVQRQALAAGHSPQKSARQPAASELGTPPSSRTRATASSGRERGRGRGQGRTARSGGAASVEPRGLCRQCVGCGTAADLQRARYTHKPEDFWCPPCRFKAMDPFNAVVDGKGFLKYMVVTQPSFSFSLDLPELRMWRREGLSVEVRMVEVDSDKIRHVWPNTMEFLANGGEGFTVRAPEDGHKRRDVPQEVGAVLKVGSNAISVSMSDGNFAGFAMALVLTRPCSDVELGSRVQRCPEAPAAARIRAKLSRVRGPEDIVCLSSDTLRLRCPLTMERIEDPVRGDRCEHLHCFDLAAYLTSNRQMRAFNNRWVCPFCTLVLRPSDLRRDAYVAKVLAGAPEEVEEVASAASEAQPRGQGTNCEQQSTDRRGLRRASQHPTREQRRVEVCLCERVRGEGGRK